MSNTSTNINARIFSPYVVVGGEEKTRLLFTLKDTEGYTISAGITVGDVIRYSPGNMEYTRSKADSDENAEVVGVVESISGGSYNVVGHGSIKYPAARLNAITQGGVGGIDVLFLDATVDGGLTGTIDISSGEEKLVKPVLQIAPHGEYNARVLNHIGYKTGNKAVLELDKDIVPLGTIVFSAFSRYTDDSWINVPVASTLGGVSIYFTDVLSVNISDYPDLWNYFVSSTNPIPLRYSYRIKLDTPFDIQYLGKISQSIQPFSILDSSGEIVTSSNGFIIFDATDTNYIELMVTDAERPDFIESNLGLYLKDSSYSITGSFDVLNSPAFTLSTNGNSLNYLKRFLPPPVNPNKIPTIFGFNNTVLTAWLKAKKDSFLVRVPTELTIDTLKIDSSLELTGTNLETRLAAIESRLANICSSIGLGC